MRQEGAHRVTWSATPHDHRPLPCFGAAFQRFVVQLGPGGAFWIVFGIRLLAMSAGMHQNVGKASHDVSLPPYFHATSLCFSFPSAFKGCRSVLFDGRASGAACNQLAKQRRILSPKPFCIHLLRRFCPRAASLVRPRRREWQHPPSADRCCSPRSRQTAAARVYLGPAIPTMTADDRPG